MIILQWFAMNQRIHIHIHMNRTIVSCIKLAWYFIPIDWSSKSFAWCFFCIFFLAQVSSSQFERRSVRPWSVECLSFLISFAWKFSNHRINSIFHVSLWFNSKFIMNGMEWNGCLHCTHFVAALFFSLLFSSSFIVGPLKRVACVNNVCSPAFYLRVAKICCRYQLDDDKENSLVSHTQLCTWHWFIASFYFLTRQSRLFAFDESGFTLDKIYLDISWWLPVNLELERWTVNCGPRKMRNKKMFSWTFCRKNGY